MKVLITGATNGVGKGVAKVLATCDNQEHEIIILARSPKLAESTVSEIKKDTRNTKVSYVLCDLAKLEEVQKAIQQIRDQHNYLDGVFINAGIGYAPKRIETEDGLDSHFQVNYLSQFMLTLRLLYLLEKSEKGGRVIFNATEMGEIFWQDFQMKEKWSYERGIHQAMAAKRMFMLKLHRMYQTRQDAKVSFFCFQIHKVVWTNQVNLIPAPMKMIVQVMKLFGKFISMEECGQTIAPLFSESRQETMKRSGTFVSWIKGKYVTLTEKPHILDQEAQDRLWDRSLELCAEQAPII